MQFEREDIVKALADFKKVVEPEKNEANWWAGAPSVAFDPENHEFWLAVRMRTAEGRRGQRGYEIRILKSKEGEKFDVVRKIHRKDLGVPVLERPALVFTPDRKFRLYGCSPFLGQWTIWKLDDADDIESLDPETIDVVLHPPLNETPSAALSGYKDPFVIWYGGQWHMTVIGEAHKMAARPYHFVSKNGVDWESWHADVLNGKPATFFEATGWHKWATRPACFVPLQLGVLFVYEGSHLNWHDAVYNLATGLAYSPDMIQWYDLTPNEPLLKSTTPGNFHTWRYSHWLAVEGEMYVYWEGARPNDTFATRMAKFPLDDA
ncbi:MAG: hypothetical protein ACFFCS_00185 [Candidatus Hodarchaeota archaeon]